MLSLTLTYDIVCYSIFNLHHLFTILN